MMRSTPASSTPPYQVPSGNTCTTGPHCGGSWVQELAFNNGLPVGTQTWYPTTDDAIAGQAEVVVLAEGDVRKFAGLGEVFDLIHRHRARLAAIRSQETHLRDLPAEFDITGHGKAFLQYAEFAKALALFDWAPAAD